MITRQTIRQMKILFSPATRENKFRNGLNKFDVSLCVLRSFLPGKRRKSGRVLLVDADWTSLLPTWAILYFYQFTKKRNLKWLVLMFRSFSFRYHLSVGSLVCGNVHAPNPKKIPSQSLWKVFKCICGIFHRLRYMPIMSLCSCAIWWVTYTSIVDRTSDCFSLKIKTNLCCVRES